MGEIVAARTTANKSLISQRGCFLIGVYALVAERPLTVTSFRVIAYDLRPTPMVLGEAGRQFVYSIFPSLVHNNSNPFFQLQIHRST